MCCLLTLLIQLASRIARSLILILVVMVPVITAARNPAHVDRTTTVDDNRHIDYGSRVSVAVSRHTSQIQDNFTYPFKTIFDKGLRDVVKDTPKIQDIVVELNMAFEWSVVIRLDYSSGLSASQKIELQKSVQSQLQSKWYINYVGNNGITCIPEDCHIPWPGFVIGELIVGFLPLIVSASNITTTSVRLSWVLTTDIGGREFLILNPDNWIRDPTNYILARLPGTASSYDVTGLTPGTTYRFWVFMTDVNGNYTDSRAIVVSTIPIS